MEDTYKDRTSLVKGAKDIAKEVKRQTVKKVNKTVDKVQDGYTQRSYKQFKDEEDDEDYYTQGGNYDGEANDDEGSSEATEGHDEDDEIYEGEYQGIPNIGQGKDGIVALQQPIHDEYKDRHELETERKADEEELAQQYELIIQECGHGRFQWALFFVLGMALMADGVEVFVVGFVLPSAETDMCIPNSGSGWLGSIVYLGMMLGAFFWGGLADKVGRRQSLLICMSVNGFFAFLSSFVQGYGLFLFCRLFSGFGIGGAVPTVFSYFSEVLAREKRGEHLSWLCMFWMIGGIYASAMAWAIIPHYGWSFSMGSAYQFHSWRVFVVVCALPCVSSVVALTFMPESPRFLLEVGKHDEAWMILKQIHDTNMRARGQPEKVFTVNRIKTPKQIDELIEIQSDTGTWYRRCFVRIRTELYGIWLTFMRCFNYPVKDNTIKLTAVWFTLSFGYYGLSVWFPDVIKHLQSDEYASKVKHFNGERIVDFNFNFTLENQIHMNGSYINDRFIMMKFKSVTFEDSLFKNCLFEDITSVSTYFRNCTFVDTNFSSTDLEQYKFIDTEFINCIFKHNKTGCQITFDDDYSAYWIYFVNFLGTLAVLPGNIVSALLMDRIGRLTMLGGSMVLSGISCFFLWFGTSESMMIGMLCLYNGLTISAWNSLDVITVELYPTDRRATGFGFLNALCKAAAVLGNLIFGSLVGITKAIPILLASTVLVCGGLVGLRLPDTRTQVLM
ncbi:synaptic vesicle glycoprotein 2C isoform X1 [Trachemys scripta elegans]|uniref:Synaptic vesicle glycoprotein 2C n=2 Tax=Emydidae TaxID=8476 RepID=A0A8C3F467_CHRPI|nr:synaptic vesicle glycoprotein 2C isoform X1 [Chrysemys picta bellii]XP_024049860.1 synaptic vesicle glycoprotein 2C [Terrapene carolina triunguis]XP_034629774.1 synaptic vesicle glycoprotein 2C isoform X1 [Trachemys scripta elegans]XP_034629775.1 synaptic vesicle glycoprotein 2C isoform X1 [Trachemys scripta elegans]XP_034629776.1 synaptic vesicle glycoprotein 2C isoform X1 [Trachemys scripta elegans]XP_042711891.1 synaptic vesicle glycoprotein 2C isoform X1 [Chrysemys picta bellii]XP_0427